MTDDSLLQAILQRLQNYSAKVFQLRCKLQLAETNDITLLLLLAVYHDTSFRAYKVECFTCHGGLVATVCDY